MSTPVLPVALTLESMQVAAVESAPACLPGDFPAGGVAVPGHADLHSLSVWDEEQEWSRFSQSPLPSSSVNAGEAGLWESQVLVSGMHCAACSLMLEQALLAMPGVLSVKVSAASQRASVRWSSGLTKPSQWLLAPRAIGYTLSPALDTTASDQARVDARLALWRWLVAGFCMMQVLMYAFPAYIS